MYAKLIEPGTSANGDVNPDAFCLLGLIPDPLPTPNICLGLGIIPI